MAAHGGGYTPLTDTGRRARRIAVSSITPGVSDTPLYDEATSMVYGATWGPKAEGADSGAGSSSGTSPVKKENPDSSDDDVLSNVSSTSIKNVNQTGNTGPKKGNAQTAGPKRARASVRAVHIIDDPDAADATTQAELVALRKQITDMEGRDKKRARIEAAVAREITAADVTAMRKFLEEEKRYKSEIMDNPFMQYAIGVADMTGAKRKTEYVNESYTVLLEDMGGKDVAQMMSVANRAESILRKHNVTTIVRDGDAALDGNVLAIEVNVIYNDLAKTMDAMAKRMAVLDALKDLMRPRPDGQVEEIISQSLITRSKKVMDIAMRKGADWEQYGIGLDQLLMNEETMRLLMVAVANDINFGKLQTTSMPKSRMDRKIAVQLLGQSLAALCRYPAREISNSRRMGGMISYGVMPAPIPGFGGRTQYTASGLPVRSYI